MLNDDAHKLLELYRSHDHVRQCPLDEQHSVNADNRFERIKYASPSRLADESSGVVIASFDWAEEEGNQDDILARSVSVSTEIVTSLPTLDIVK